MAFANINNLSINERVCDVEIADTASKLTKGLMFKKEGRMLLSFHFPARHGIWMFCMKFPLDLIFIDKNNCIINIVENAKPMTLNPKTWKLYYPKKRCKHVLEAETGFAKKMGYKPGDVIEIDKINK
ncbi:MAG: DUF192 domain-containing protein [Candidatus Aenigmarchaeota archaeon]|nr:DUF192 domain-containing protein [Candidatus Aenigmarchaeota archaeon]